jgi:hypothetical protein
MNSKTIAAGAVGLTLIGCIQMVGDLAGAATIKGLGAATHASPAPRVFTAHEGFETFSSRFFLHWAEDAQRHSMRITPENYAGLRGPYNRRNAYGAALSYGPVLASNPVTRPMFKSVSRHALCGHAPVLRELGIDPERIDGGPTIALKPRDPRSANGDWPLTFTMDCAGEPTT